MKLAAWPSAVGAMMLFLTLDAPALAGEKLALASGRSGTPSYAAGVGLSALIKFELLPNGQDRSAGLGVARRGRQRQIAADR